MSKRYHWPKWVWLYEPDDFYDGILWRATCGKNQCCILGWAVHVFGRITFAGLNRLSNEAAFESLSDKVADALIATKPRNSWNSGHSAKAIWRTSDQVSTDSNARWWKRFVEYLGYTEAA